MTRIRYKKDKEKNCVISEKPVLCGNKFVNIIIYLDTMEWRIQDALTDKVLFEGINNTLKKIKKDIKIATIKLGATFYDDVKSRKLIIK